MSMFHVGQKVVLVDDSNWQDEAIKRAYGCHFPVVGAVYTIRGFCCDGGFYLSEIPNLPIKTKIGICEISFLAWRFRPVVNTDISIFTAMLKQVTHGERV